MQGCATIVVQGEGEGPLTRNPTKKVNEVNANELKEAVARLQGEVTTTLSCDRDGYWLVLTGENGETVELAVNETEE